LSAAGDADRRELLAAYVRRQVARSLGMVDAEKLDPRTLLSNAGLDSLIALELRKRLEADTGIDLPLRAFFDSTTVLSLAEHLAGALAQDGPAKERRSLEGGATDARAAYPLTFAQERLWFIEQLQ